MKATVNSAPEQMSRRTSNPPPRSEGHETSAAPTTRSLSEQFRERLGEEHFLATQRVSWLLLAQSFLFIAYTALVVSRPTPAHEHQVSRLLLAVPLLGIVIVIGVYASILAALLTIRALRARLNALEPEHPNPFDAIPTASVRTLGHAAAHVPPLAILATCVWLLITGGAP